MYIFIVEEYRAKNLAQGEQLHIYTRKPLTKYIVQIAIMAIIIVIIAINVSDHPSGS